MNRFKEALVQFYASHTIEAIEGNPKLMESEFGKPLSELCKDGAFNDANSLVKRLKRVVENDERSFPRVGAQEQVVAALKLLHRQTPSKEGGVVFPTEEQQILTALLREKYRWLGCAKEHFDLWVDPVREWYSYFLSYTNESVTDLNNDYKRVIRYFLPKHRISTMDWDRDNLVADAIVFLLTKENLTKGFYDKSKVSHGDILKRTIEPACEKTFAFLQLVHREVFLWRETNWAFEEYTVFAQKNDQMMKSLRQYEAVLERRYRAVVAAEEARAAVPADMPPHYREWQSRVFREGHYKKLPTDPKAFRNVVREVADAIVGLRTEILTNVPAARVD